jgi:hypothetical protein
MERWQPQRTKMFKLLDAPVRPAVLPQCLHASWRHRVAPAVGQSGQPAHAEYSHPSSVTLRRQDTSQRAAGSEQGHFEYPTVVKSTKRRTDMGACTSSPASGGRGRGGEVETAIDQMVRAVRKHPESDSAREVAREPSARAPRAPRHSPSDGGMLVGCEYPVSSPTHCSRLHVALTRPNTRCPIAVGGADTITARPLPPNICPPELRGVSHRREPPPPPNQTCYPHGCACLSAQHAVDVCMLQDEHRLIKLLTSGACPDGKPDVGGSALHRAVHRKAVSFTRLLLEAGACVDITDKHGRTPLDIARIRLQGQPSEGRERILHMVLAASRKLQWVQLEASLREGKGGTEVTLRVPEEDADDEADDTQRPSPPLTTSNMCVVCHEPYLQVCASVALLLTPATFAVLSSVQVSVFCLRLLPSTPHDAPSLGCG